MFSTSTQTFTNKSSDTDPSLELIEFSKTLVPEPIPKCKLAKKTFVFELDRTNDIVTYKTSVQPSDDETAAFGRSISVSQNRFVVGYPLADSEDLTDRGHAYIYDIDPTTWITTENERIRHFEGLNTAGAEFGYDVAIENNVTIVTMPDSSAISSGGGGANLYFPDSNQQ
jgi:hypothetical protein